LLQASTQLILHRSPYKIISGLRTVKLNSLIAIYDFEFFPYALGDVLTWNVRTAMLCEELGRKSVNIYICLDSRHLSRVFQLDLIGKDNYELFFSELYTAFGTHPCLGNISIFRTREDLIENLMHAAESDPIAAETIEEYLLVLEKSEKYKFLSDMVSAIRRRLAPIKDALKGTLPKKAWKVIFKLADPAGSKVTEYFDKHIHSHEMINAFSVKFGQIPILLEALGCSPDIDEFMSQRLLGKKIVPFHLRLRRLDAGYGGDETYDRDSDFLEWYDFLLLAARRYNDVTFVALGRLQEKPLVLLGLPNVISLRSFGMGLGHELTLMNRSDLFIGSSSGFAAYANFSRTPYFITKMSPGACRAYVISEGSTRLPFAFPKQELVYEKETSEMLMGLLERGLGLESTQVENVSKDPATTTDFKSQSEMVDVETWRNACLDPRNPAATTRRFRSDTNYREAETGFLLDPVFDRIDALLKQGHRNEAMTLLARVNKNFPELSPRLPKFVSLSAILQT
jgi:hypothetical protein